MKCGGKITFKVNLKDAIEKGKFTNALLEKGGGGISKDLCAKVKKLKKEYRKLKDTLNETRQGRNKVEWPYFELMDRILGHKPTTVPESIVDSLAQSQDSNDSSSAIREVNEVDETLFGENSDTGTITSTNDTSTIREVSSPAQCKCNKKKKRSRGDQFEVVMNSNRRPNIISGKE